MTGVPPAAKHFVESEVVRNWLGRSFGIAEPAIRDLRSPTGGGWSSETWLMTLRDGRDPASQGHRIVLRLAPSGPAMFPEYDLGRQVACMHALSGLGGCPLPRILADDSAGVATGRPLFVMEFVPGDIPSDDRPTFFEAGFLFEAGPADQRRFHLNFLAALAVLHDAKPAPDLVARLARREAGATPLARELAWLRALFDFGRGPAPQPLIDRAFDRLAAVLPADDDAVLLWGDARPANVVVRDFTPVALLDWELAALGPREFDIFWFLEMNRMRSRGRPLPGFLGDEETVAHYRDLTGHVLGHAAWHTLFAATKVAILMLRHLLVRVAAGDMPGDHAVITDNVATRRLADLLATPEPL